MHKRLVIILSLISAIGFSQNSNKGTLVGKLLDKDLGNQSLPFANVQIKGTLKGATTDFDGLYKIENLDPGTYTVVFSFVGYTSVEVPDVEIVADKVTEVNTTLTSSAASLQEVVITTVSRKDSEVALLLEQKGAISIKESIGSQQLAKLGVSDAAVATTKISGVSNSEGSGDIYVRGLGDRYLLTTLNGLPIPSDDVEKKNIDLSLFPTRLVQNISISKAYSVNMYGDQASGNVDITSRELVGNEEYSLGFSTGINTEAVGANDFKLGAYQSDVNLGFYNNYPNNFDALTQQSWNTESVEAPVNQNFNFTAGKKFGDKFRTLVTASQKSKFEFRSGTFQEYDNNNFRDGFTDVEEYRKEVTTSALLDLSYRFNDKNKVKFTSLFVNKLSGQVFEAGRNGEGVVFDEVDPQSELNQFIRDQNIKKTQLWVNQLIGESEMGVHNIDWAVGLNTVNADEPNRIRNEINFTDTRVELGRTGGFQQRKSNQIIDDYEVNARINDSFKVTNLKEEENDFGLKVDVGGNFRFKERDFASQFTGIQETNLNNVNPPSIDDLSSVFTLDNVENGLLAYVSQQPDSYLGELESLGAYALFNYKMEKWNFNFGGRFESNTINVNWNVNNFPGRIGAAVKEYENFLPSLNLKYELNDNNNLRLSASKTITLPEFKEISPFEYVSPNGQVTRGNPNLEASENYNLDLKWEMFPSNGELISVAGFYKQINDPINRVLTRGAAGIFSYFNSGEQAEIYGLELDTKLDVIARDKDLGYMVNVNFNATRMWHEQDLKEVFEIINGENRLTRTFRYNGKTKTDLQGASDWIFNANTTFETTGENPFVANISANYASEKIFALGNPDNQVNPDEFFNEEIREQGFVVLNAVLRKDINENLSVQLIGKNLLNPQIERTQTIKPLSTGVSREEVVRSYTRGAQLSIGFNYNF
ncbi:TonB-dependent receptor [Psychroflexus gondwanensis]|jgi:outer membrane receptor protein involved in Fe transport|uniref:TonB-dependent receptor n=1 Tax=Psychroflexus gondwanensis TaxID=251 RepID=UPI0011BFE302|nr:TonB-dependent receptor [Psychroflexus gondwanensis]TXE17756.1 TonB-dependent receptor [Psychroflexus gondwanensis]